GFRLFWLAPLIVAIVVVPEFIQHIAEIRIGMFESEAAFNRLAADPRRMIWGYFKIAGLILCIMAASRYWAARMRGQNWWDMRHIAWKNLGIAIGLILLTGLPVELVEPTLGERSALYVGLIVSLLTLPLIALFVAGLVGDRDIGLVSVFKTGWLTALRIVVFAALVWIPLQTLHTANHDWAMGQTDPVVWALMAFDALVVGALAGLTGTAFHHAYEARRSKDISI
ncbi:MAG: hypothetical protein WA908_09820, partial [Pontixanthobacter sp.]